MSRLSVDSCFWLRENWGPQDWPSAASRGLSGAPRPPLLRWMVGKKLPPAAPARSPFAAGVLLDGGGWRGREPWWGVCLDGCLGRWGVWGVRGGRGVRLSPWRGETAGHRAHPECISEACSRTVLTSPGSPISSWHHQRPTASSLESALPSGVHLRLKTALLEGRHTQTQRHTQTHTHTDTHTRDRGHAGTQCACAGKGARPV